MRCLIPTLVALMACNRESVATDTDPATDTDVGADTCAPLDVTACAEDSSCRVLSGGRILPGNEGFPNCAFEASALGCMGVGLDCYDTVFRAAAPGDPSTCFQFDDGCVPAGWVACDPDPGEATETCQG